MKKPTLHGGLLRGLQTNPKSNSFNGMFGRMFRTIPAAIHTESDLLELGRRMVAKEEEVPTPETEIDNEENQGIDAGYTYLGQFIDHDLTFDPLSSLIKQNDPDGLTDYRTPRFDLDNVYGRGPDDQPYLYENDGRKMLLGRKLDGTENKGTRDVPRLDPDNFSDPQMAKRALIGDPRNDENVIVSQLQATFLRFHNRMVDLMPNASFTEIQQQVRWHYQWVVLNDFLPTIAGKKVLYSVFPHLESGQSILSDRPHIKFYHFKDEPYMPVEFSVGAYRFGHSMIRPLYRLNTFLDGRQVIFDFKNKHESLLGFREFPNGWGIDWDLFFHNGKSPLLGKDRVQKSYKIDTSLVDPLGHLPPQVTGGHQLPSLAERNLIRGWKMGLPSGQAVARYMGITPLKEDELRVGKGTEESFGSNIRISDISPKFRANAPLWFYVLAEAMHYSFKGKDSDPFKLGPVGGRIVTEVFAGLLLGDSNSFLSLNPDWKPRQDFMHEGSFGMRQLIDQALKTE